MTEIDKLIEEASNEHKDETDYIASQEYICGCSNENDKLFCWEASTACSIQARESFKAGANFIFHLNRWRKVEEELPIPTYRNLDEKYLIKGYYKVGQVIGKEIFDTAYINKDVFREFNKVIFDVNTNFIVTEWKSII
ncbi:hypothetical protein [Dysgonomonas termitidis]|uniref:Uncharacterized protein n=1 Tax=Dysgonomonas termitidis TaxID=1516126 RepID=A0ABV9L1P9_9BACT